MVKAPWNRNRTRPSEVKIPTEVEEYYQSTHKERRGIAWLLGLATLALTLLIAVVIFFGVRFIYNKFFTKNESGSTQQTEVTTPEVNADKNNNSGSTTNNDQNANSNNNPNQSQPNNNPQPNNTQTPTSQQPKPNESTNTPITGPSEPEIPHTGPTSND